MLQEGACQAYSSVDHHKKQNQKGVVIYDVSKPL
jgi:hypothetical protein